MITHMFLAVVYELLYSKLLKKGYIGKYYGVLKWDTRSFDYSTQMGYPVCNHAYNREHVEVSDTTEILLASLHSSIEAPS